MSSDTLLAPLIGLAGVVIGAIVMCIISGRAAARTTYQAKQTQKAEILSVEGEAVDIRELRILRSLFGETNGRRLGSFKDKYYQPSLDATIDKGWVKQVGSRYCMTAKGEEFCRTYLKQLLSDWKPED